jgi:hypothetical protein
MLVSFSARLRWGLVAPKQQIAGYGEVSDIASMGAWMASVESRYVAGAEWP